MEGEICTVRSIDNTYNLSSGERLLGATKYLSEYYVSNTLEIIHKNTEIRVILLFI